MSTAPCSKSSYDERYVEEVREPQQSVVAQKGRITFGDARSTSRAFQLESWSYIQHKDYQLHLLQKKEGVEKRRTIPASLAERLAFFRMYYTAMFKIELCTVSNLNFNFFIRSSVFTALFKTIPYSYIVMFLSTFSPDQHMFISKMVPLFWGSKIQIIIASFAELVASADVLTIQLDYVVNGLIYQHPWNKCPENITTIIGRKIHCYTMGRFQEVLRTQNVTAINYWYINWNLSTSNRDGIYYFWPAQQRFYAMRRKMYFGIDDMLIHEIIFRLMIWCTAALCTHYVYHKYFWKMLYICHWLLVGLFFLILVMCLTRHCSTNRKLLTAPYTVPKDFLDVRDSLPENETTCSTHPTEQLVLEAKPFSILKSTQTKSREDFRKEKSIDFALLSDSVSSPPILHMITSRTQEPVDTGWDSCLLSFSNLIFFLLKTITSHSMKVFCEYKTGVEFYLNAFNSFPGFFYYPVFFYKMFFGDIFTLIAYIFTFITEFMIFIVLFYCHNEVIYWEWKSVYMNKWIVSILTIVAAGFLVTFTRSFSRSILLIFCHVVPNVSEIVILLLFYPYGRFFDDITFWTRAEPSRLILYNLFVLPIFYFIKIYMCMVNLFRFFDTKVYTDGVKFSLYEASCQYYWIIPVAPLILGFFYAFYKYVVRKRKGWKSLITPLPTWGPRDFILRQLRKRFDSREFVPSQSSRYLARHMLQKLDNATFKFDIRYDYVRQRSSAREEKLKEVSSEEFSATKLKGDISSTRATAQSSTYNLDTAEFNSLAEDDDEVFEN